MYNGAGCGRVMLWEGIMGRNDNRGLFRHIEELQERIDSLCLEVSQLKEYGRALEDEIRALKAENAELKAENRRFVDDNIRLKRILNNNSKNSSLPHLHAILCLHVAK